MKKNTLITLLTVFTFFCANAQQEKGIFGINNWLHNWTDFQSNTATYNEPTEILTGHISKDIKLSKKYVYLLLGNVFVTDSVTISIEPGTVIIGDYATKGSLTISKGATIIANGTETDPIVFTSNRSRKRQGDWGGLIILGDAPTNKFGNGSLSNLYSNLSTKSYQYTNYGGENLESSSGVLRFVRIEYAGKRTSKDNYFNALTLAGVGSKTVIENIMVSYSESNSFEILGGKTNLYKLVSYKAGSADFKFNFGAQSHIQNSLAIRTPYTSNSNGPRCMQLFSYDKSSEVDFTKKGTSVIAENITLFNWSEDLEADLDKDLIAEALYVGNNTTIDMSKSVISGFNPAIILDDQIKINQESLEQIKFSEMYFNNCRGNIFLENNSNNADLENWYGNLSFFNVYSKGKDSETFINILNTKLPDFRLRINKIIATNDYEDDDNDD